jgi:hypothetical protein
MSRALLWLDDAALVGHAGKCQLVLLLVEMLLDRSSGDISQELQHLSPGRYRPLQKCPNPSCALLATYQVKGTHGNMGPAV